MIACYYRIDTISPNLERFRYIDITTLYVPMVAGHLRAILPAILREFCGATVVGYNQSTESYWCKIDHRTDTLLRVEICIQPTTDGATRVTILPHIGADRMIAQFTSNFEESIQLYTTSPFIRASLTDRLTR